MGMKATHVELGEFLQNVITLPLEVLLTLMEIY